MSVRDDYGFLTTYMEYGEEDEEDDEAKGRLSQ